MATYRWFTNPRTGKLWAFPRDVGRYTNMAERTDHPCKHGHFGCAVWDGGPCSSEETSAARSGKSPDEATEVHTELFALVRELLKTTDVKYLRQCILVCHLHGELRGPIDQSNLHLFRRYRNTVTGNAQKLIEEATHYTPSPGQIADAGLDPWDDD